MCVCVCALCSPSNSSYLAPKTAADATPVAPTPHDLSKCVCVCVGVCVFIMLTSHHLWLYIAVVPYSAQNTAADATSLAPTPYDLGKSL